MAVVNITLARLRELLIYSPESGQFIRRCSRMGFASGTIAGGQPTTYGYIRIHLDGHKYMAHRLAWLYVTGEWPTEHIDHEDTNRANNRFDNLRKANKSENGQNTRAARNTNQCGFLGVSKNRDRFFSRIMLDGKVRHLGMFDTPEEAHAAYITAKRALHPFGNL